MIKKILNPILIFTLIPFFFLMNSCDNPRKDSRGQNVAGKPGIGTKIKPDQKIGKVIYYIENSASMFGYVSGFTNYVDVVSELAYKSRFVQEKTEQGFNFINGGNKINITPLGNKPSVLKNKLNPSGFNPGDITKSNLNMMFQIALNKARADTISILLSDAIYDIEQPKTALNPLAIEGKQTRSKFITRLDKGDLETIMIKLNSKFNGWYYYASRKGKVKLNQQRPFYIWIFGNSELLNKYFPNTYITEKLKGYENLARYLKADTTTSIPYQVLTSKDVIGTFRPAHTNKNKLLDVEADRHGHGFQFTIAVDFSSLPFSDSYLTSVENYSINLSYKIKSIIKQNKKLIGVPFTPYYLITVFTNKSPYGKLEISLKNRNPEWISKTNSNNELDMKNDTTHTYGFKYLTNAISEAYADINGDKNIANFNIEIDK